MEPLQRRPFELDAVSVLSVYLVALWFIQARWVVGPLGGIGTPAVLIGLAAAAWRLSGLEPRVGFRSGWQPVRVVLLVQGWYFALSYGLARLGPLTELETSGSTRALISLVGLTGVALVAADGIRSRDRLETLLRRLVVIAAVIAVVGLLQFVARVDVVQILRWPLLSLNTELGGLGTRSRFSRPYGTALHPIEFGAVLAMVLPFALHFFFTSGTKRERVRFGIAAALIGLGIAMSMSRTGLLGAAIAIVVLSFLWSWRLRLNVAILGVGAVAATWVTIPGLVGTIKNLFLRAGDDPSIDARLERIPRVLELVREAPWMGRGYGVFSVEEYLLLDNSMFETLIETGVIGLIVTLVTFVVAIATARGVRYRGHDPATRHLGQAVAASLIVALVSSATFSAFFYRIYMGTTFLLFGCAGALWRLEGRPAWTHDLTISRHERTPAR